MLSRAGALQPKTRSVVFLSTHPSGGIRELWANLAEGFRQRGYDAGLAALYPAPIGGDEPAAGLRWRHFSEHKPGSPLAIARMLAALTRWLRAERPDVIVTAMPAANVLLPLVARLASPATRIVISHHSPADTHNAVLNALDGVVGGTRNVAAVVSVSNAVAGSLAGKPRRYLDKRRTIHNALPPAIEALLAATGTDAVRRARRRTAIATGRLAEQKNYPMLLRAAVHMPDVRIEVIGGGPDEVALKAQAQALGVEDWVAFLGHRPREDALRLLADGDIFLQMSLFEGHSLALVEAAKLGLPLIVSNVPVQVEGVTAGDGTRCGIVIDLGDDEGLARAVRRLLDDPEEYGRWSASARALAAESTFDTMLERYQAAMA